MEEVFQINLREIVRSKAPQAYKKIPGFLINWLERIVHQKEINELLAKYHGYRGVEFMQRCLEYFDIRLEIVGQENLPDSEQKVIFSSNHPLGGMDGICLSSYLGGQYNGNIRSLVNDLLYFLEPLQDIFIPINKHGGQAKSAAEALNKAFASDNQIITFPAGLCSRKTKGVIRDTEWKKMFIAKAIDYQRDVVPVYFEAKNSNFFYRLANIRKRLGIKFNLEMLFLPHEMFKSKHKTFTVYFGKPISWQTFDSSKTHQQWADWVKELSYNLKTQ